MSSSLMTHEDKNVAVARETITKKTQELKHMNVPTTIQGNKKKIYDVLIIKRM